MSLAECAQQFGSNKKSKLISGEVVGVINKPTATGRQRRYIQDKFSLDGDVFRVASLSARSINVATVTSNPPLVCLIDTEPSTG